MKQIIQSYKTGKMEVVDVPLPACRNNGILIQNTASLISVGTEKRLIDVAKKSLVGKAKARPDLVKQVINKMKKEGFKSTLDKVFTKLEAAGAAESPWRGRPRGGGGGPEPVRRIRPGRRALQALRFYRRERRESRRRDFIRDYCRQDARVACKVPQVGKHGVPGVLAVQRFYF